MFLYDVTDANPNGDPVDENKPRIDEETGKTFVKEMEDKFATTVKHRSLGRSVSYRRLIRLELYKLQKHLMEENEYEPFVARW